MPKKKTMAKAKAKKKTMPKRAEKNETVSAVKRVVKQAAKLDPVKAVRKRKAKRAAAKKKKKNETFVPHLGGTG